MDTTKEALDTTKEALDTTKNELEKEKMLNEKKDKALKQFQLDTAKMLKDLNVSLEIIMQKTKLSKKEIEKL